jgi:hypothetical protein
VPGTLLTCFAGTKVQILPLLLVAQHLRREEEHFQFTCCTGTRVHILTPQLVAQHLRSEEEHFLRWVAGKKLQGLSEAEGGVKEGKAGGEKEQVVEKGGGEKEEAAGAAAVVLEALRKVIESRKRRSCGSGVRRYSSLRPHTVVAERRIH